MRRRFPKMLAGGFSLLAAAQNPAGAMSTDEQRSLLDEYCVQCHNFEDWAGGVAFDVMELEQIAKDAKIWEEAVRRMRAGMMPPVGEARPDEKVLDAMVVSLETTLDDHAAAHPNPGHIALHRLNRQEYANAVADLLSVTVDPSAMLPKDDISDGFDNVAAVLKVSPSFMEQYISAAQTVSSLAIGNASARNETATYRVPPGTDQRSHIEGLPLGTRGGMLIEHQFPVDGEYRFSIGGLVSAGYLLGLEYNHTVVMTLDGRPVFRADVGGEDDLKTIDQGQAAAVKAVGAKFTDIPVQVTAGPHKVGVTFIARSFVESDDTLSALQPGSSMDRIARVSRMDITGPFNAAGISSTPSRDRIFVCQPADASEEEACAEEILSSLARRAFRRPVTAKDLAAPLKFFRNGRAAGGSFDAGIQNGLLAILASPKFLYRAEIPPADARPGDTYTISDVELASRLSFFLWSRLPDDELLALAEAGRLSDPKVLDAQIDRMLADPRAQSLATNFAFQWLQVRKLNDIDPDANLFPEWLGDLRDDFKTEIALFVGSIIEGDRPVTDLMNADYTFVNERLALHYDIKGVRGDQFRRVTLTDPNRFGLLGKGSVLLVTSYPNRTSPVLRGAFVLENIIGSQPPTPPPNVDALPETVDGGVALTVRDRMVKHRENPGCFSCHALLDPLGLALENYNVVGEWRSKDRDAGQVIDASGVLPDGQPITSPATLREAIMAEPAHFVQALTEKLMTYALGRGVEYYDMPVLRRVVRNAEQDDYRFSAIVKGIITSTPFTQRMVAVPELQTADATPLPKGAN
ncbi:MAG: DUF1592 domain-containing protein [Gammaproteobacteria bacterium]|nr:DUF1592 domain-containing protein [Gammaproteobacteria bacterium]